MSCFNLFLRLFTGLLASTVFITYNYNFFRTYIISFVFECNLINERYAKKRLFKFTSCIDDKGWWEEVCAAGVGTDGSSLLLRVFGYRQIHSLIQTIQLKQPDLIFPSVGSSTFSSECVSVGFWQSMATSLPKAYRNPYT